MKRMIPIGALMALLALFFLWGCDNDTSNDVGDGGGNVTDKSCLGCHSSEEMLKASLPEESGSKVAVAIKSDG